MSHTDTVDRNDRDRRGGTRFVKGHSGNPRGRPKGRHLEAPYETVLGRQLVIRDHSVERTVSASEAFLLHMTKVGLGGDGHAARSTMAALEAVRERQTETEQSSPPNLGDVFARIRERVQKYGRRDSVSNIMCRFKMATKLDRYRSTTRTLINPWLVEAALERLGNRHLTPAEQATVVAATRSPHRVRWPDWWVVGTAEATKW